MEEYLEAVLYAYPLLKKTEETYGECIKNKALLSYRSSKPAEAVAEAIANEILEKENLLWLKERVERMTDKLSEGERSLLALRFFGKGAKMKKSTLDKLEREQVLGKELSQRQYFRILNRVGEKAASMLVAEGVTRELYEEKFSKVELLKKIGVWLRRMRGGKLGETVT